MGCSLKDELTSKKTTKPEENVLPEASKISKIRFQELAIISLTHRYYTITVLLTLKTWRPTSNENIVTL